MVPLDTYLTPTTISTMFLKMNSHLWGSYLLLSLSSQKSLSCCNDMDFPFLNEFFIVGNSHIYSLFVFVMSTECQLSVII